MNPKEEPVYTWLSYYYSTSSQPTVALMTYSSFGSKENNEMERNKNKIFIVFFFFPYLRVLIDEIYLLV